MRTVTKFLVTLVLAGLSISSAIAQNTYIITSNGANYDVNGGAIIADCSLWNAIDAIKTAANSADCTIQFGATDPLELYIEGGANTLIRFNNDYSEWGKITFTGKAVANFENYGIIMYVETNVLIDCKAELTINGKEGAWGVTAIYNSGGTVTITDGTILATGKYGKGVDNRYGRVNISGGTISATGEGGKTVDNYTGGTLTISGGTISASGYFGTAVYNYIGSVNISGGTMLATGNVGTAVDNNEGTLNISGGVLLATGNSGKAVGNYNSTVALTGGILFAHGTTDTDVINGAYTQTGNAVIVAWNKAAGTTTYITGTTTDIYKNPESATAIWATQEGNNGISIKNGDNKGFITIEGITLTGVGVEELRMENGEWRIYPNPTNGELRIENGEWKIENVEIFDVYGRKIFNFQLSTFNSINVSHLSTGIYFLRIGNKTVKFVKE